MGNRHRAREIAMQLLYQRREAGAQVEELIEDYFTGRPVNEETRAYAESLIRGASDDLNFIDQLLDEASQNWSLDRILPIDLTILRLAAFEMLFGGIAPAVAIDEALILARRFSSSKSAPFINGVLDKVKHLGKAKKAALNALKEKP